MAGKTRKWTDIFFVLWLILAGVGIVFLSVSTLPVTVFGKSKDFGLVCLGLLDVLGILMLLTGRSDWAGMSGKKKRGRAEAFRFLILFLLGTAVYVIYCIADSRYYFWGNDVRNALVSGGVICAAFFLGRKQGENQGKCFFLLA